LHYRPRLQAVRPAADQFRRPGRGPSDRLYLLHWLKALDPDLTEGLHFPSMLYGGKLLGHLSGAGLAYHRKEASKDGKPRRADKLLVARQVCAQPAKLDVDDLTEKLARLVFAIRKANDLAAMLPA
jgi:hypothetical protein